MQLEAEYDIWIDFARMLDDGRVWTRIKDVRSGFVRIAGQYAVVGCEDADPAVAQIVTVDIEEGIQVRVLPGSVDEHRHLLTTALSSRRRQLWSSFYEGFDAGEATGLLAAAHVRRRRPRHRQFRRHWRPRDF